MIRADLRLIRIDLYGGDDDQSTIYMGEMMIKSDRRSGG